MNTAQARLPAHHLVHRLAHAVYGLILLTATVGELQVRDEDAQSAMAFVAAGAVVLVIAHSYSQLIAASATSQSFPRRPVIVANLVDQLALALPASLAVAVFAAAETELMSIDAAYTVVLIASLSALFAIGITIGLHRRANITWALGIGIANAALGGAIVAIEVAASH